ncbi:hypothetical protein ACFLTP_08105 [Chloroflexota bacterium]
MLKVELVSGLTNYIETAVRGEHMIVWKQLIAPGQGNEELEENFETIRLFLY